MHVLNGFVVVQAAAHFGARALAVVWRGPVSNIVGELAKPVVKHGIKRP